MPQLRRLWFQPRTMFTPVAMGPGSRSVWTTLRVARTSLVRDDVYRFLFQTAKPSRSRGLIYPSFCQIIGPRKREGAGNAGCFPHPQLRVQRMKARRSIHHRYAEQSGIPCAMVLTISFVISPVIGLSCHRHLVRCASIVTKLDISVEMSGPHDFVVHETRARQPRTSRPPHPAPNVQ
jgi:hypothetical protein